MKFIIFQAMILTIIFSGCTSVTEYWPWNDEKAEEVQVPIVVEEYGSVSYIDSGDATATELRKKEAYDQMYTECNGEYKVIGKISEESTTVSFSNSSGTNFNEKIKNITIKFICP